MRLPLEIGWPGGSSLAARPRHNVNEVAPCVRCSNESCSVVVILPSVPDSDKRTDHERHYLEIDCPACCYTSSISFGEVFFRRVTDDDLLVGYISA